MSWGTKYPRERLRNSGVSVARDFDLSEIEIAARTEFQMFEIAVVREGL